MKVAILISDDGDGTASLRWFKNIELAEEIAEEKDQFNMNEGSEIIDVPEDFNPPGGFDDEYYGPGCEE